MVVPTPEVVFALVRALWLPCTTKVWALRPEVSAPVKLADTSVMTGAECEAFRGEIPDTVSAA